MAETRILFSALKSFTSSSDSARPCLKAVKVARAKLLFWTADRDGERLSRECAMGV